MNISRFFIDRPIFAGVVSTLIFLSGLIAMFQLPISEYPEVSPPSIVIRAQFPGGNPTEIAETVAAPLEEQINGVEGMLYMNSLATTDGNLSITVTFEIGTDPDIAQDKHVVVTGTALAETVFAGVFPSVCHEVAEGYPPSVVP